MGGDVLGGSVDSVAIVGVGGVEGMGARVRMGDERIALA